MLVWHQLSHFLRRVRSCIRYFVTSGSRAFTVRQSLTNSLSRLFYFFIFSSFIFILQIFAEDYSSRKFLNILLFTVSKHSNSVIHVLAGLLALEYQNLASKVKKSNWPSWAWVYLHGCAFIDFSDVIEMQSSEPDLSWMVSMTDTCRSEMWRSRGTEKNARLDSASAGRR